MSLIIHTDGGSRGNPGPAAAAFIIEDLAHQIVHRQGNFLGHTTNNQAEYKAVLFALNWLTDNNYHHLQLHFFLDSLLVVNQLSGLYKIKDHHLLVIATQINNLISAGKFSPKFTYLPRSQNSAADMLVNQTLDTQSSF